MLRMKKYFDDGNKKPKKKYEDTEVGKLKKVFPKDKDKVVKIITNLKEKIKKNSITIEEINNNLFEFGYSLKINNNKCKYYCIC